jgi:hypothetical protein
MQNEIANMHVGASVKFARCAIELMPVELTTVLGLRRRSKPKDRGPEGPKHKDWNKRYRKSLGKKLKKLGLTKDTIKTILDEYREATIKTFKGDKRAMAKFVAKWLLLLINVKGAIRAEYKEEGAAPKWDK